jgi:hypothetical protein
MCGNANKNASESHRIVFRISNEGGLAHSCRMQSAAAFAVVLVTAPD